MADFCRECTAELFGPTYADQNDMILPKLKDDEIAVGLCEGCGIGWFDPTGLRVDKRVEDE